MKLKSAIEQSPEKVAILIRRIGNDCQIITAIHPQCSEYKFEYICYKDGSFASSGGMWKRDAPTNDNNWQPLNVEDAEHQSELKRGDGEKWS
ncbi:hypothetical protein LCGC14_1696460 [marine sediment metagenome]|uniref:Uncharacterized protein n=1 Tax=marine sediment metagenome TaxID=412755 RepID=A0A0F9HJR3_9ZZZZ